MSKMYKVSGCQHTDEISFYPWDTNKEFPNRELLETTRREFEGEFESMDEASLWLITYHPDLYMGHSVVAMDESGDFSLHCVPGHYYVEWNTLDDDKILMEEMARLIARVHFADRPAIPDNGKHFDDGDMEDYYPDDQYEDQDNDQEDDFYDYTEWYEKQEEEHYYRYHARR